MKKMEAGLSGVRGIIFDLDGTLLDTLADIADSMNRVLTILGYATRPAPEYRYVVGGGLTQLLRNLLPPDHQDRVEDARTLFWDEYGKGCTINSRVYPGIPELLDFCVKQDIRIAVLSNKPDPFTRHLVEYYLGQWPLKPVFGQRHDLPIKPDPAVALQIAGEFGLPPRAIAFVGDSDLDMQTGVNAGMVPVGAVWGFRSQEELERHGAKLLPATPSELLHILFDVYKFNI